MAKLSDHIHKFVENTFDIPKRDTPGGIPRPEIVKPDYRKEFCMHCYLVRVPIHKDGEFIRWDYQQ